jgi:energy-coupling factor transporter transmembrane protein EcfT
MNNVVFTRLKLLALILFSTVLVLIRNMYFIGIACGAIVAVSGAKMRGGTLKSRLIAIVGVSLLVVVFQAIQNRLLLGIITAIRLISLSLLVLLFTETTSASAIVSALSFLPKKITLMLTISFSLIPAILQEISAIRIAQQARGFSPRGINIFPVLIPLLNRTLTRAEHIAIVLQTRGYD